MKKIYSLFILSILALTMFVGCQMPTDGTVNGLSAEEQDADETTYGFVKTVDYTVYKDNVAFPKKIKGSILISISKENNFAKDIDYTINANNVYVVTGSSLDAWLTPENLGKLTNNGNTYTVNVPINNITGSSGNPYKLVIQNSPIDGYKKGDQVEILITNGNQDVNTGWGTPEGLYLVKVHIYEGKTELTDIPVTVTKDHKIQFTMPEKNINVFAQFCDIKTNGDLIVKNLTDNEVTAVLCFNCKAYDNLEPVDGKYVLELGTLNVGLMRFTETKYGNYYELSKDGTLNDNQYTFGVIDNQALKILVGVNKNKLLWFTYEVSPSK